MKTKISLITLFACAVAGTSLFADNEDYDGQTIAAWTSFKGKSLVNSSWIGAVVGDPSFQGADLTGANFTNATITKGNFSSDSTYGTTNLTDAVFTGATIMDSYFGGAILTNADFAGATITDSYFGGAILTNADFTEAVITGTDFINSGLTLSQLHSTASYKAKDLAGVYLNSLDLSGENFADFNLADSLLTANLTSANFTRANLTNASLGDSTLTEADFTEAVITGAHFERSGLTLSQLHSTASYKAKDLSGVGLSFLDSLDLRGENFAGFNMAESGLTTDLTGANFTGANLTHASVGGANLTDVNFTGADLTTADIMGANLTRTDFAQATLIHAMFDGSTLIDAKFVGADLTDASFERATCTNIDFTGATLVSTSFARAVVQNVNFTNANMTYASFLSATLTDADFTGATLEEGSFHGTNVQNANFTNANLTNAQFFSAVITGADFTNAVITGVTFFVSSSSSLTLSQLYSTASYKARDLSGVYLEESDLSGGNFAGVNLTGARLPCTLTEADFTNAVLRNVSLENAKLSGADFRGASGLALTWDADTQTFSQKIKGTNVILSDGTIGNFDVSTGTTLTIREHEISAKIQESCSVLGDIVVKDGAALEVIDDAMLTLGENGSIVFGENTELHFGVSESTASSIVVADSGCVEFSSTTKLIVDFFGTVSGTINYALLTWTDGASVSDLSSLTKERDILLLVNGIAYSNALWDFSTENNELTISIHKNRSIIINGIDQVINLPGTEYVGTFDASLTEFRGTISGEGSIHSGYDLTFAGNASAHTGTTYVDGGTFTIVDAAKLGTGAFEVASAGTLRIEGTRDFSNELSGMGTLTTAGEITLSGDASAFTGTTKVESGTLTIAESATLGTGDFEIAGTLVIDGDRTFKNATSGNGTLRVASGTTTFAQNIGVKTLSVSENATATLADGIGMTHADANIELAGTLNLNGEHDFAATLSGTGKLATNGNVDFKSDASAFTGKISVNAGTFAVAESAKLGNGDFEVSGTLAINGTRDFENATSGIGTLKVASGTTTFTTDIGVKTLSVSENATATLADNVGMTHADANIALAGTLNLNGTRTFANTLSGTGKLATSGNVNFTSDASAFTGTTKVESGTLTVAESAKLGTGDFEIARTLALNGTRDFSNKLSGAGTLTTTDAITLSGNASDFSGTTKVESGTLTVAETAKLGTGDFEIAGTLAIDGNRTFKNATSGNGTLKITSGETTFTKDVGVKKLSVADGAMLRGNVSMAHGANSVFELAGTLVLDAAAGEKVSLGNGKVVIKSTAKLDLSGTSSAAILPTSAVVYDAASTESALLSGRSVTIFENGTVQFDSGADVVSFLGTDTTLGALATRYAVVYDASSGLTVQTLTNPSALTSTLDKSNISTSFLNWAIGGLEDDLASLGTGFVSADDIDGWNNPLLKALLAGDAGTARAILDRLSPKSYAAMIAMPVETFHDDVRSISSRLEQRRYDALGQDASSWEFFAQAQMISVDNDTAKSAPTFDFDRYGVLAGADVKLDPTLLVGIALGAGTGEAKIHNGGGKIESDDYRLNVFGGKTFAERFYVNAGAQLGFASYDVKRKTDYGNANASADGWNAGAFAETGAVLTISDAYKLYAMPYFGLAYTHAATDSFKESGSDAAFDADSLSGDSLRARLGCSFSWRFDVAGARWRVGLDVAYSHELLDDEIDVDVKATDDGSKISETAKALPEDVFSIGPSVNVDLTKSASIYAGYSFNAGTDSATAHNANVGFRMRF